VNRNTNSPTCECLDNFQDASIEQPFCIPEFCLVYNIDGSCQTCGVTRLLDNNGFACVCPLHYYDTGINGICKICSSAIVGCIDCNSSTLCIRCDERQGYLLIGKSAAATECILRLSTNQYILSQTHNGILVQIKMAP
jgi:hypothetical protein